MVFDMNNETDVQVMASMVSALQKEQVEFVLRRVLESGRSYVKLIV